MSPEAVEILTRLQEVADIGLGGVALFMLFKLDRKVEKNADKIDAAEQRIAKLEAKVAT